VAGQAALAIRDESARLLGRERMALHARSLLHADTVDLPVLMTPETGVPVRAERVHRPLVAVPADKLLDIHVPGVSGRLVDRYRPLGDVVPMAFDAGLPGRFLAVWFRRFSIGAENEFDQQPVLLDDPEMMAVLTDDVPVAR